MESMCRAGDQSSKIDRLRLAGIASRLPIPSSFSKASWKGSDTVDVAVYAISTRSRERFRARSGVERLGRPACEH